MAKVIRDVTITVKIAIEVDDAMSPERIERYLDKAIDNGLSNGLDESIGVEITESWNASTEIQVTDRN